MAIWHLSQDWVSCGPTSKSGVLSGHCSGPKLRAEVALFQIGDDIFSTGSSRPFQRHALRPIPTLSHLATFLGLSQQQQSQSQSQTLTCTIFKEY
jgi:hypothetical protein